MKLKRFFTGVLSAVMALSVCALPAAADDEDTTLTTPSTSTIDTSKKGSITIHKYVMTNVDDAKTSNNGETVAASKIPTGATAASGAKFTLYKVMTKDDLIAYYNNGAETTPKAENYLDSDGKVNIEMVKNFDDADKNGEKCVVEMPATNTDGVSTISDLELGLYLAVETTTPAAVTSAIQPFLISVPMTKVDTAKDNSKSADSWLYDIHVYPKNSTAVGEITLKKLGVIGNDTENGEGLADVRFKLEHLIDGKENAMEEDSNWKQIESNETDKYFTTGSDGTVKINNLKPGTYRFTEIGYATKASNKFIINNGAKYVFEVKAVEGNKVTVSKPAGADNSDDYKADGNTVTVYNYAPDVDKQVYNTTQNNNQKFADCGIDDTIQYQVKVVLPENVQKLKKFILTDTPKGIVDDVSSVEIYSKLPDDSDSQGTKLSKNTEYTVTESDDGFVVAFDMKNVGKYKGQTLFVCYTAKLKKNPDGTLAGTTSTTGNPNTIDLTYSNKINIDRDKEDSDENKSHIKDDAVVYSFEIDVVKTAETTNGEPLPGVKFDLYKQVEKGKKDALNDATAKNYGFDTTNASYVLVKSDLTTDDEGKISYKGLANGKYWLRETKTVKGYNLLASPVKVELNLTYKLTWEENKYYTNNTLVKHDYTKKEENFNKEATQGTDGKTYGIASTNIVNKKGFTLPVTGGFGTLLFSGIGVLLVLAGVVVLFSMKKKNDRA